MASPAQKKRILLSAYACEPGLGSEPAVGWHWAINLARAGHDVWVLTRANNAPVIAHGLDDPEAASGRVHFLYYDLPRWAGWWKKGRRGIHLYYFLWQWRAAALAKKEHAKTPFDLVHHVTLVSARQPSFLGRLGVPFVFGPVAGGEKAPFRLRFGFSIRGWIGELARDALNALARYDPFLRRTYRRASKIYLTSKENCRFVPRSEWPKTSIVLAIGTGPSDAPAVAPPVKAAGEGLRVLYVGHFLDLKGMHLGLPAFAGLCQLDPNARLTLIGDGPSEGRWRRLASHLGIADRIAWHSWMPQEELLAAYAAHDVLLFPSLRDSGGMVVLEAMQQGLPVVCLDRGGPGVIANDACGRVVATDGLDRKAVIGGLSRALRSLAGDMVLRMRLSRGAKDRVAAFSWKEKVARILAEVEGR